MKPVNAKARAVLDRLTDGLTQVEASRQVDNTSGAFMAVHVECIGQVREGLLYSVAHYYEQHGDLMRDPDVVFLKDAGGDYYAMSYEQSSLGIYQEAAVFEGDRIVGHKPRMQRDITLFCNDWMQNIKAQQFA